MKRALALLALILVAAIAYAVRVHAGSQRALAGSEAALLGTRWLIDDVRTAGHLRRIELAIAADRLPQRDRWLEHPQGGEVPWLPLYDTALAALAERVASETSTLPPAVAESSIEDVVLRSPPWLGALAVLAVAWAAAGLVGGPSAAVAALLAALVCALAPAAIRSSALGQLDASAWLALLAALQIGLGARAVMAREPLDAIFGALLSGLVSGLALASSIAGCALFVGAWSGFAVRAFVAAEDERSLAHRAGLCFCAVSAFVGQLPLTDGPWQGSGPGLLSMWSFGASQAVLFAAVPFLIGALLRSPTRGRAFQTAALAIVLGLLGFYLPATFGRMRSAVTAFASWHSTSSLFEPQNGSWSLDEAFAALTSVSLLFLPSAVLLARGLRQPANALLLALASITLAFAFADPRLLALFVVPMACTLACAAARGLEAPSIRARRTAQVVCALAVILLAVQAARAGRDLRTDETHAERVELVRGLRWMRTQTPSAGAFNAASVPGDYAVLCTPGIASLVVYHARRPTLASTLALAAGAENLREIARALAGHDGEHLVRVMHASEARYLVTGPRCLTELAALTAVAGLRLGDGSQPQESREESTLWRMSMTPESDRADPVAGLTRVYASPLSVGVDGRAARAGVSAGPAISIWRLDAAPPARTRAELRPR